MKKRISYFTGLLLLGFCTRLCAQSKISIHIDSQIDSLYYLAHYFGTRIHPDNTAKWQNGKVIFEQESKFDEGLYLVLNSKKERIFEFLLGEDQTFEVFIPTLTDIRTYTISGKSETASFLKQTQAASAARNAILLLSEKKDMDTKRQIDSISRKLETFRETLITDNKGRFLASFLNAMKEPVVPDSISSQQEAYNYYKSHYWDSFDLNDERLLRTPLMDKKLNAYFNQIIPPLPDSITTEIDRLILKAKDCTEVRDYLLWNFLKQYEYPKYMGQDAVFVYLYDNYFSKLEIKNLNDKNKAIIHDKTERFRRLLLYSVSPELMLKDCTGKLMTLHSVKSEFTLLFFYDHECEICTMEMKDIDSLISLSSYDITVFAVDMNPDLQAWKKEVDKKFNKYVNVNGLYGKTKDVVSLYNIETTPLLFVLDRNKRIIAKAIQAKQIPSILQQNSHD
jgi:AhpC/TSA family.